MSKAASLFYNTTKSRQGKITEPTQQRSMTFAGMSSNDSLPSPTPSIHHLDTQTTRSFFSKGMLDLLNATTEEPPKTSLMGHAPQNIGPVLPTLESNPAVISPITYIPNPAQKLPDTLPTPFSHKS